MFTRSAIRLFSTESLKVINDVARERFSISLSGNEALIGYEKCGKTIKFVRTDVPKIFQGKGVGKILAKHAFDFALENKLDVICECEFLEKFYIKNKNNYKALNIKFDIKEH